MTAEHSQRLREVGQETDRGWKACTGHQRESEHVAVIKKGAIMKTDPNYFSRHFDFWMCADRLYKVSHGKKGCQGADRRTS